ncbi:MULTISPECIES: MauE/DoxX family redox-associated membrane protein [Mameliella]|uniref:MauE/DoxX family redox-associated membrane protein n=1 Tax=Mameliella TaxID=1434019 RepID=UPI000B537F3F|nr:MULTISPECIES: MauE/DoxX family redox-associated membrane protein [Mameliella]OWV40318.1 glutaredoxin [Mameliella alba]OWV58870.1 glutaredoxin [Mameliella alba]
MPKDTETKTAEIYRKVMPGHICPYGLKSKDLLERQGFRVEDHPLETHDETRAFMEKHDVATTPQTFIDGKRIGGYDDLRIFFEIDVPSEEQDGTTYQPVIAIFSVAALLALAFSWHQYGSLLTVRGFEWFISLSMAILAIQKLQDVEGFSLMFLNYDLLAQRWVPYGKLYPFGEAFAAILMTAGVLIWIAAPIALFIGTVGAISVFKAVYIERRELKCACVGGESAVPLGFISLTENLMMIFMGIWMPVQAFWL